MSIKFSKEIPLWSVLLTILTCLTAYFTQREVTSVAVSRLEISMQQVQQTLQRLESDRYTGAEAKRDFSLRDERISDLASRVSLIEQDRRRK